MRNAIILSGLIFLGGCAGSGIVKMSTNTYMISQASAAGAFANMPKVKAKVIEKANKFAEKQGKVVVPISLEESRPVVGFPSFEYQFMLVDPHNSGLGQNDVMDDLDFLKEGQEYQHELDSQESDLYTELRKLEDLQKNGVLSEEQIQQKKEALFEKYD